MLRVLTSLLIMLFVMGCSGGDSSDSSVYKNGSITHTDGFDFSADSTATWENQDVYSMGSTIMLADTIIEKIYNAGKVELDSISSVDESKFTDDTSIEVEVDYVYILKARDGYVKFKVISISDDFDTGITIEYKYSTTTTF